MACRLCLNASLATHDPYFHMLHAGAHSRVWRSLHAEMLSGSRRYRASMRCRMLLFIGIDRAMPKKTRRKASGGAISHSRATSDPGPWWSCCRRRCLSCCSGRARASSATSGSWRVSPVLWVMVGARGTIGSASTGHRVTHLHEPLLSGAARRAASRKNASRRM